MNKYIGVGTLIKTMRQARGMTQQELADAMSVRRTHIAALEAGKHLPRVMTFASLAKAFDVDLIWLLEQVKKELENNGTN